MFYFSSKKRAKRQRGSALLARIQSRPGDDDDDDNDIKMEKERKMRTQPRAQKTVASKENERF